MADMTPQEFQQFTQSPVTFNPLYTSDSTQSANQLQQLQSALAYAQANPDPDPSQQSYLINSLNADIQAQQSVGGYLGDQSQQTQLSQQLNQINSQIQQLQGTDPSHTDTSQWNLIKQYTPQLIQMYQNDAGFRSQVADQTGNGTLAGFQAYLANPNTSQNPVITTGQLTKAMQTAQTNLNNQIGTAQTQFNTDQSNLLNNITLNNPNYNGMSQQLENYYYGQNGQGGEIAQATQPALQNIYQQNFDMKNNVNQAAQSQGAMQSGMRQKALADTQASSINNAAQVVSQAANTAASNMANFKQGQQTAQQGQQDLINSLKSGGATNLLSSATNQAIQNFGQNTNAQSQQALTNSEQALQQAQQNQQGINNIVAPIAGTAGTVAGYMI